MDDSTYCVAIVAVPDFASRLAQLAERMHVWVADTPLNRAAAEPIWAQSSAPSIERGVTTFQLTTDEAPDAAVARILPDVELHHGECSHNPPVNRLEIHGAALTPRLREALYSLGFSHLDASDAHIVASLAHAV